MTNKLPVEGKRYRHKENSLHYKVSSVELHRNEWFIYLDNKAGYSEDEFWQKYEELPDSNSQEPEECCPIETAEAAWNMSEAEIEVSETPNPVDLEKKEVNEVERALEELQSELKDWFEGFPDFFLSKPECNHTWAGKRIGDTCEDCDDKFFSKVRPFCQNGVYYTLRKAQNLINALEAAKEVTQEDWEKYHANHKYKSEYQEDIMSKPEPKIDMKEERVEPVSIWKDKAFVRWCDLTDFCEKFEQMQKDVEELKKK